MNLRWYNEFKGNEIYAFYPGTRGGSNPETHVNCNNVEKMDCWQKAKLLSHEPDDEDCSFTQHRCMHVAWRDGDTAHAYTCPNWIRHPINNLVCRLPGIG